MPIGNTTVRQKFISATEIRVVDGGEGKPSKIVGHAAVFDQLSVRMKTKGGKEFYERINPGAFKRSLESNPDIVALVSHDPSKVLARTSSKTLRLSEDERGLAFEIDPPNTSVARDLMEDIRHGNVKGVSFGFDDPEAEWTRDGDKNIRTITSCELGEVSPTAFPAYPDTDIDLRSIDVAIHRLETRSTGETRAVIEIEDCSLAWTCRWAINASRNAFDQFNNVIDVVSRVKEGTLDESDMRAIQDFTDSVADLRSKAKSVVQVLSALGAPPPPTPDDPPETSSRMKTLELIQRAAESGQNTAALRDLLKTT